MIKMTVTDTENNSDSAILRGDELPKDSFKAFSMYLTARLSTDKTTFQPITHDTIVNSYEALLCDEYVIIPDDSSTLIAADDIGPMTITFTIIK